MALGVALIPVPATAAAVESASPLLSIDQNRTTVVDRIVTTWGDALAASGSGLTKVQLQALLRGLRSDHLLAASLAGSLDGLRNVIANALTASVPVAKGLIQIQHLHAHNLLAAEGEKLLGQIRSPLDRFVDLPQRIGGLGIERRVQQAKAGMTLDNGEDIAKIVRHPGGQMTDGLHFLRLAQLRFEFQAL